MSDTGRAPTDKLERSKITSIIEGEGSGRTAMVLYYRMMTDGRWRVTVYFGGGRQAAFEFEPYNAAEYELLNLKIRMMS